MIKAGRLVSLLEGDAGWLSGGDNVYFTDALRGVRAICCWVVDAEFGVCRRGGRRSVPARDQTAAAAADSRHGSRRGAALRSHRRGAAGERCHYSARGFPRAGDQADNGGDAGAALEQAIRDSLRAQPFDPAAVRAAMAQSSQAKDRFVELVHETVAGATAKMSPAGRQALADWRRRRVAAATTTQ